MNLFRYENKIIELLSVRTKKKIRMQMRFKKKSSNHTHALSKNKEFKNFTSSDHLM